uniref:Uncharacterized protein n=1 Tax=Romanomermis culicivorax TaxID=13658 RepID=A0A915KQI1_ROMCU
TASFYRKAVKPSPFLLFASRTRIVPLFIIDNQATVDYTSNQQERRALGPGPSFQSASSGKPIRGSSPGSGLLRDLGG